MNTTKRKQATQTSQIGNTGSIQQMLRQLNNGLHQQQQAVQGLNRVFGATSGGTTGMTGTRRRGRPPATTTL